MNIESVSDIYAANDRIHEKLRQTVSNLSDETLNAKPDGERWSVAHIVEHVAMVSESGLKICSKLMRAAESAGAVSDGPPRLSENFAKMSAEVGAVKLEAPAFVEPSGEMAVADALAAIDGSAAKLNELRPLFESFNCNDGKFPHPFFGDMSAAEWLMLVGGHEARHLRQIQALLEKM